MYVESSPSDAAGGGDGSADESDYGERDSCSSSEESDSMSSTGSDSDGEDSDGGSYQEERPRPRRARASGSGGTTRRRRSTEGGSASAGGSGSGLRALTDAQRAQIWDIYFKHKEQGKGHEGKTDVVAVVAEVERELGITLTTKQIKDLIRLMRHRKEMEKEGMKTGPLSEEEKEEIVRLVEEADAAAGRGSKDTRPKGFWESIAASMPGRHFDQVKKTYTSHLKSIANAKLKTGPFTPEEVSPCIQLQYEHCLAVLSVI